MFSNFPETLLALEQYSKKQKKLLDIRVKVSMGASLTKSEKQYHEHLMNTDIVFYDSLSKEVFARTCPLALMLKERDNSKAKYYYFRSN